MNNQIHERLSDRAAKIEYPEPHININVRGIYDVNESGTPVINYTGFLEMLMDSGYYKTEEGYMNAPWGYKHESFTVLEMKAIVLDSLIFDTDEHACGVMLQNAGYLFSKDFLEFLPTYVERSKTPMI